MNDAAGDLVRAYDWVAEGIRDGEPLPAELMWTLAVDIAEQPEVPIETRVEYLAKTIPLLEAKTQALEVNGNTQELFVVSAISCHAKIALATLREFRSSIPGAGDLTSENNTQYWELVTDYQEEFEAALERNTAHTLKQIDGGELADSEIGAVSGAVFESFVYSTILGQVVNTRSVFEAVRPATLREDDSRVHTAFSDPAHRDKYSTHNSQVENINFDVLYSRLADEIPKHGEAALRKIYIQLKTKPKRAQANEKHINNRLVDTKRFMYMSIADFTTIPHFDPLRSKSKARAIKTMETILEYLSIRNEDKRLSVSEKRLEGLDS